MTSTITPVRKSFIRRLASLYPYAHYFLFVLTLLTTLMPMILLLLGFGLKFDSKVLNSLLFFWKPLRCLNGGSLSLLTSSFLFLGVIYFELVYWREKLKTLVTLKIWHYFILCLVVLLFVWNFWIILEHYLCLVFRCAKLSDLSLHVFVVDYILEPISHIWPFYLIL